MGENNNELRLSELERQSAAQSTDIRGIYAGLDEIRDVLVRIQESAKPNLGGMFLVLLATCTFLVTIGGLTMAPVYREQSRTYEALRTVMDTQNGMRANRFTRADSEALESQLRTLIDANHHRMVDKMHQNEKQMSENQQKIATLEGRLQGKDL